MRFSMRSALVVGALAMIGLAPTVVPAAAAPPVGPSPDAVVRMFGPNPSGKFRPDGSPLNRPTAAVVPSKRAATAQDTAPPECPPTLHCIWAPAAYQNNDPADPVNYGNYDLANRPQGGLSVLGVVDHDIEGTCQDAVRAFQNPLYFVSAHYVICADGTVYQTVRLRNVAWAAGNWWFNTHYINIEHAGHAALGSTEYTPAMYHASVVLHLYLAGLFHFPLDRQHVIGHDNVPATRAAGYAAMHVDPGPFWDWQDFMLQLGAPPVSPPGLKMVVVAPVWPLNKQTVTACWPDPSTCVMSTNAPTSIVYIRTAPRADAPMLTDPVLGLGSTDLGNTAARAYYGQKYGLIGVQLDANGIWYHVWYGGQAGWIDSPYAAPTVFPASGAYITPKAGLSTIQVFGRPVPNQSDYPANFSPPAGSVSYPTPLTPYAIPAGQKYAVVSGPTPTDWYFAWTFNSSLPYDHTDFVGTTRYYEIQFAAGRYGFVRADDVAVAN